jgi:hypothetical protein
MEYWNDGIVGGVFALFLVILHCVIHTPRSKRRVILCYGSWMAPKGEKLKSDKLRVMNDELEKTFQEGKYG